MSKKIRKNIVLYNLAGALFSDSLDVTMKDEEGGYIAITPEKDFSNRSIKVRLRNLSTVEVIVDYHVLPYSSKMADKRHAIKTARDIFDFYHDIMAGNYTKVAPVNQGKKLERLGIYYQNSTKRQAVVITATRSFDFYTFGHNAASLLLKFSRELDGLTYLIEDDVKHDPAKNRWNTIVEVGDPWWKH